MKDFKKSTVYQIYPKSFNDSNGDGIGDLNGVIEKLDYLSELGIDYIWLTPFFVSPQIDNGYDIEDYYNIDPIFGTIDDFDNLVLECKKRNIKIMLDMVFNHTSTKHKWFKNALNGDQKYKDFYIFKKGINGKEPTNWQSKFGGSAWEYVEKFNEYYLHLFDRTQGDLNWENEEVRNEIYKIVTFWINKGVKGFRLDVVNLISKPEKFENDQIGDGRRFYTDGPKIHKYLKELNKNTFGKYEDMVTVGEMSSTSIESCIKYTNPKEKELSMVFNFHHLKVDYDKGDKWTLMDFDFKKLKSLFKSWQEEMEKGNGWNALFWCNHDQPRIVSRFGNTDKYHKESAKMLATTMYMMRGTPYVYQGEEIGMTNPDFDSIEQYRDVESKNYFKILQKSGIDDSKIYRILNSKSRDNSRTPMQWDDSKNAGFSGADPWIPVGKSYKSINVETALKDKNSIFYHYKKLIKLRKEYDVISYGSFKIILENHDKVLAYTRKLENTELVILNNFYSENTEVILDESVTFDNSKILLSNYSDSINLQKKIILRPYESVVYILEK
ncbi:Trehalose-6-phosphate hydrolase [Clostridium neonatale]|uniref:alpha,alpha-phosphotrehalase n=1 Tax=Clostridium neonatale TaxID=137838 RepID=UPI00291B8076|nr:alpha,alpha-phosphotrehalase [Clostridium neonatale]CAI3537267.1 Trehalose-6-phosphate hydrolase [Clostridium neonatale]